MVTRLVTLSIGRALTALSGQGGLACVVLIEAAQALLRVGRYPDDAFEVAEVVGFVAVRTSET